MLICIKFILSAYPFYYIYTYILNIYSWSSNHYLEYRTQISGIPRTSQSDLEVPDTSSWFRSIMPSISQNLRPGSIVFEITLEFDCIYFLGNWILFYLDLSLYMLFQCIDGRSPLHMTAVHGRFTRAQTLFEHGERVLISACSGVSALKSVKFVNLKKRKEI